MNENPQYNLKSSQKLKVMLILILSLFFWQSLNSQSITWQRTYHVFPNDFGYKILAAPDNCFYFAGTIDNIISSYTYILKLNQFGDTIWSRRVSGGIYTAALTYDSACVFINRIGLDSLIIIKIDRNGSFIWERIINAGGICWDMKRIFDNSFVISGISSQSAFALRIDSVGNFIWQKIFSGGSTSGFYSFAESIQNGLLFTGYIQNPDSTKIYVAKLDYDGNLIWEKSYAANNNSNVGQKVIVNNESYIIGGNTDFNLEKTFLLKLDTAGNVIQTKVWVPYGSSKEFFDDMSAINTNKIVLTKRVDSSSTLYTYAKAQLIDSNFNLLREQVYYPSYSYAIFSSILPLPNRDVVFAGTFDYFSNWSSHRYDMYTVRTDSNLNTAPFPPIGLINNNQNQPKKYLLSQNSPNPFNPTTKISYEVPKTSFIEIELFDINGKFLMKLTSGSKNYGRFEIEFDGTEYSSGIYIYAMIADGKLINAKKMILLK